MAPSARQMSDKGYRLIGIIAIIAFAAFLTFKFINIKWIEKRENTENEIIFDKLRATAKLVVWEQNFKISSLTKAEKKYFDSDLLKFTEQVFTTAKGKMGFHIDLGDTLHTSFTITEKAIEIHAPLQITYVSIDNSTIKQIKESSYDPTLEVDKEKIVRQLNEIALRQNLKPALEKAKKLTLTQQEKSLTALAGRKVVIKLTEMPTIQSGLLLINDR